MASRSIIVSLTRKRCIDRSILIFGQTSFSRSLSSGALTPDPLEEYQTPQEDNLKSRIFKLRFSKRSAITAIQKWVGEGNPVAISELRRISKELRKSERYKHALEISEWMVSHEEFELSESDFAVRIDLMTKVFGIDAAERYFEGLPEAAKTGETYMALLHCYAGAKLTEKAERLFEKVKESSLTLTSLIYNEMMTMYMSVGQLEKVPLVIEELKQQNVAPDLYTYNLWISSCAATMDIDRVRKILGEMNQCSSSNENWMTYMKLTNIYITASNLMNLESNSLVEAEKNITQREWIAYDFLIILYTGLRNKDKIDQIWKSLRMTKQKMTSRNYLCILSSYLILGQLEEAGEVLHQWKQSTTADSNILMLNRLLDAFAEAGLMENAEVLRLLMTRKNCNSMEESQ